MQTYRTLAEASRVAGLQPILQISTHPDNLFIVLPGTIEEMKKADVTLLTPEEGTDRWRAAGYISMVHLDRLGHANWATLTRPTMFAAFPAPVVELEDKTAQIALGEAVMRRFK